MVNIQATYQAVRDNGGDFKSYEGAMFVGACLDAFGAALEGWGDLLTAQKSVASVGNAITPASQSKWGIRLAHLGRRAGAAGAVMMIGVDLFKMVQALREGHFGLAVASMSSSKPLS